MPHENPDHAQVMRLRGKRVALGIVIAIAVVFIGLSTAQIMRSVFGAGIVPLPSAELGSAERTCAVGVRRLEQALERGEGPSPEWEHADDVRRACAGARDGLEAWAALQRLILAQQQLTRYVHVELAPLRRDVIAHLPTDLR